MTNSSLLAMNLETGRKAWETPRPEAYTSWGTPIVWGNQGTEEIVAPGNLMLKGYNARTGEERWLLGGISHSVCTTPVLGDDLLFFAAWAPGKTDSPFPTWDQFAGEHDKDKNGMVTPEELDAPMRPFAKAIDLDHDGHLTAKDFEQLRAFLAKGENVLVAIKPGGRGDITETHSAWKATRGLPYIASPLYYKGRVYAVKDGGMVSCFHAKTGEAFYLQERLSTRGSYYASLVAADDRIIAASLEGKVTVFKAGGDKPEIVHQTDFHERIAATPALAGNRIYLRTDKNLYALGL
jgi:outer membrane protein assembly factor BamB